MSGRTFVKLARVGRPVHKGLMAGMAIMVVVGLAMLLPAKEALAQSPPAQDFFGSVVSVRGNVVVISTGGSQVEVDTTEDTVVRLPLNRDATLSDLVQGDAVAVSLDDEDGPPVAEKIFVIPAKTRYRHIPGEVVEAEDRSITIQPLGQDSELMSFEIGPVTKVIPHQGASEEIGEGDFVIVLTVRDVLTGELSPKALEVHTIAGTPSSDIGPVVGVPSPGEEASRAEVEGVFEGVDEDGRWIVSGTRVAVNGNTVIESGLAAGQLVRVEGTLREDNTVLAHQIRAVGGGRSILDRATISGYFNGTDEDGNWVVSGVAVKVIDRTDVDGKPEVGEPVTAATIIQDDSTLLARHVENGAISFIEGAGGQAEALLEGVFEGVDSAGRWRVSGIPVAVNELTRLAGSPSTGNRIEIRAVLISDGDFLARRIEVNKRSAERSYPRREVELRGTVEGVDVQHGLPVSLVINGHRVEVTELTEIEGEIVTGIPASVDAVLLEGGDLIAREVKTGWRISSDIASVDRVELKGTVQRANEAHTYLQVNGIKVAVAPRAEVKGRPFVGTTVNVKGVLQPDGFVLAHSIQVEGPQQDHPLEEQTILGVIEELVTRNGDIVALVVDGRKVLLDPVPRMVTTLEKDEPVEVRAVVRGEDIVAVEIKRKGTPGAQGEDELVDDSTRIEGEVQKIGLSGYNLVLLVDGVEVRAVVGLTEVEGRLTEGVVVEVEGSQRKEVLVARRIEVK